MLELEKAFYRRKVLIAGGLGFIGSSLARRLVEFGADVHLLDSLLPEGGANNFNIAGLEGRLAVTVGDIGDRGIIREALAGQDFLFNLAGRTSHLDSLRDPQADLTDNVTAQLSLLEACRNANPSIRIVYTGTRQVYGRPTFLPVDETHPLAPLDFNAVHKLAGEGYHILYHKIHGLHVACLRLTNVYGPRMRVKDARQGFLGWWIRLALEGRQLPVYGDGKRIRDFNFVEDVVGACLLAAIRPEAEGRIFNLGSGEPVSLLDLAQQVITAAGSGSAALIKYPPERERIEIGDFQADFTRIRSGLGWQPRARLQEGITATLDYYRENRGKYWEPESPSSI